jgi:hypothetical protein
VHERVLGFGRLHPARRRPLLLAHCVAQDATQGGRS